MQSLGSHAEPGMPPEGQRGEGSGPGSLAPCGDALGRPSGLGAKEQLAQARVCPLQEGPAEGHLHMGL